MPEKPPKFRRRAEARPDEVLDAALELFLERGFAATKVDDVAKRAGVSKGLVYLYFPSKEALIEGIVLRAVAPVADKAIAEISGFEGHPRVAISTVMRFLVMRLSDPRVMAVPRLIMREVAQFPHVAQMYRREVLDRVIPVLRDRLQRGMDQGYLRPHDPDLTLRSVVGPLVLHVLLAEVFGIRPEDGLAMDRLVENHLSILFDGLSAGEDTK
jgi:Transcriptional regulator